MNPFWQSIKAQLMTGVRFALYNDSLWKLRLEVLFIINSLVLGYFFPDMKHTFPGYFNLQTVWQLLKPLMKMLNTEVRKASDDSALHCLKSESQVKEDQTPKRSLIVLVQPDGTLPYKGHNYPVDIRLSGEIVTIKKHKKGKYRVYLGETWIATIDTKRQTIQPKVHAKK